MAEMDLQTAGLARRLGAITYDMLLLTGVLFVLAVPMPLIDEATRATWWVQLSIQFTVLGFSFFFLRLVLDTKWPNARHACVAYDHPMLRWKARDVA